MNWLLLNTGAEASLWANYALVLTHPLSFAAVGVLALGWAVRFGVKLAYVDVDDVAVLYRGAPWAGAAAAAGLWIWAVVSVFGHVDLTDQRRDWLIEIDQLRAELRAAVDRRELFEPLRLPDASQTQLSETASDAMLSPRAQEVDEAANRLQKLMDHVSGYLSPTDLEPWDQMRWRIAQATLANSRDLTEQAMSHVPRRITLVGTEMDPTKVALHLAALVERIEALFEAGQWDETVLECQRLLKESPDHWTAHHRSGICQVFAKRYRTALDHFTAVVAHFGEAAQREPQSDAKAMWAAALMKRAMVHQIAKRPAMSGPDYNQAIEVFESLVEAGDDDFVQTLAGAYANRAVARQINRQLDKAAPDFDQSVQLFEKLVDGGRDDLRNQLAMVLTNRGIAHRMRQQIDQALADYDRAVAIRQRLVKASPSDGAANDLARSLLARAAAYIHRDKQKARDDVTAALQWARDEKWRKVAERFWQRLGLGDDAKQG